MFENISKGEFWFTIGQSKAGVNVIKSENNSNNFCITNNIHDAEFISFCFNLQQKYDIGLFEEAIKTLEEIKSMCDGNIDKENSIWFECNHILKKLNQNK